MGRFQGKDRTGDQSPGNISDPGSPSRPTSPPITTGNAATAAALAAAVAASDIIRTKLLFGGRDHTGLNHNILPSPGVEPDEVIQPTSQDDGEEEEEIKVDED